MMTLTVLLVDDNPDDRALVERELKQHLDGVTVLHASDARTLGEAIEQAGFDVVITDYRLRWTTGTEILREMKQRFPQTPVIMFTGSGNEEVAVAAMKEGLDDYITKTVKHYPRVPYAVQACVERARQREQLAQALERERLAKIRLEIALASARMGTWEADLATQELSFSAATGAMFGMDPGATSTSLDAWLANVEPEDLPGIRAAWNAALGGQGDFAAQFRIRQADGQQRWFASSGRVVLGEDQAPKMVIGASRDMTDEVAVRDQILHQQKELESILNVLPVGVAISRDPEAQRVMLTPHIAELIGIEPNLIFPTSHEDVPARPFQAWRNGQPVDEEDLPMRRTARTGIAVMGEEIDLQLADGRTLNLLINTAPLLGEGNQMRGVVAALMDVTSLKKIQKELEASNRQKVEFLAVLSHELRNPVAAISYSIELLRHVGSPNAIDKARAVIERQTAHMGKLLNDLLDLTRITSDKIELNLEPLDLRRLIEIGYESTRSQIEPRAHEVTMALPDTPLFVRGDEVRLIQVIVNILGNAAKFTPVGGRIHIHARAEAGRAVVEIADSGIGIDPDQVEQVFNMFYQGQSKAAGADGLGIGLAVVQRVVALHEGVVKAESEGPGKGARFRVELPLLMQDFPQKRNAKSASSQRVRQGTVLVADDNLDAADLLTYALQMDGYKVLTAYDGRSAIELARQTPPDVAVLDIGMPGASGNEVASWIRQQPWGENVTLLAVTGWGQADDRAETARAGFNRHLVKPIVSSEISRLVAEALASRSKTA